MESFVAIDLRVGGQDSAAPLLVCLLLQREASTMNYKRLPEIEAMLVWLHGKLLDWEILSLQLLIPVLNCHKEVL